MDKNATLMQAVRDAVTEAVNRKDLMAIEALFTELRLASTVAGACDARLRGIPWDDETRTAYGDICLHAWDTCVQRLEASMRAHAEVH